MVTIDDVREVALGLPRPTRPSFRGRIKFRVGQIVFVAFSADETLMGFGPGRSARRSSTGPTSSSSRAADMRYQWVVARMEALDGDDARAGHRRLADVRPQEGGGRVPGRGRAPT